MKEVKKPRVKITRQTPVCDMVGPSEEIAAECSSQCGQPLTGTSMQCSNEDDCDEVRDKIHERIKDSLIFGLKNH